MVHYVPFIGIYHTFIIINLLLNKFHRNPLLTKSYLIQPEYITAYNFPHTQFLCYTFPHVKKYANHPGYPR